MCRNVLLPLPQVREVEMVCLADNLPMRRIAQKVGAQLRHAPGELDGRVELAWATPLTLWQEALANVQAVVSGVTDQLLPGGPPGPEQAI